MKKILLLIYFLLLPFYSAFGQSEIGVSVHDTTIVAGEIVFIPVYVDSSLTGHEVSSYNFQFSFNDYYFVVDSAFTTGSMTDGWGVFEYNTNIEERITIAAAGSTDLEGTGILFYLRLRSVRSGSPMLYFTDAGNNYFNEGDPLVITDDGRITMNNPASINVYPDEHIMAVGDTKDFNVSYGTSPYTWSVTQPSIATIDENGLLTATGSGNLKVVCEDAAGIVDTTNGIIEIRPFKLTVRDTAFYQGNSISLPIYTTDLTGLNYTAGQIIMDVNGSYLTPTEIITTGTLLETYSSNPQFSFNNNNLSIAFAGETPLSGSGILMYVVFQISNENTYGTYINFENILFNETDLGLGERGYFDVLPLAEISISPSTATLLAGETQLFLANSGTPPYTWSVSNPTLASINSDGELTALKGGVITVHVEDTYGGNGNTDNIYLYDTQVWFPDTTGSNGTTIDLPMYMGNLDPSYSIVSMQTQINFDSSRVHFIETVTTGTSTNGWSFSTNNTGNSVTIAGAGATGFNSAGVIVYLRFEISQTANEGYYSNINFNNLMFNEGSPNAYIDNGRITISNVDPPVAPTNLIAVGGNFLVDLTWTDSSNNENGFKIERTTDTTSAWSEIATVSQNATSYSNTGLAEGTQYFYRVRAYNGVGYSDYTNVANDITVLFAPSSLAAMQEGVNNVNLFWVDNSSSENGYVIEVAENAGAFTTIDTVLANIESYIDSNLSLAVIYHYRIFAFNDITTSEYSNLVDFTLEDVLPVAPTNLVASTVDSASISLSWTDNSDNENGFMIEEKVGQMGNWTQMYSLSENTTEYDVSGLIDGTQYFYRVNAFNTEGNSDYSNIDSAITIMNPPRNLEGLNIDQYSNEINWMDFSASEDGFIIERADGPIIGNLIYEIIDTVGTDITTYIDSNLSLASSFVYKVKAYNLITESDYSNEEEVVLVGLEDNSGLPNSFEVFQNYPNPFNPTTMIKFNLPERSNVSIKIFNLLGSEIDALISHPFDAGFQEISWDASEVPSGVYLIYFRFEGQESQSVHTFTKKAILVK